MVQRRDQEVVPDFIFGTLATEQQRVEHLKRQRRGLWHEPRLSPPDPSPGEVIRVEVSLGPEIAADRVSLYYTTDGSTPIGARGQALNGQAVALERVAVEWDTLVWGYRERWEGVIPPQAAGTEVRYIIEAWRSLDGYSVQAGEEGPCVFAFVVDREATPAWIHDAVIYHILVDRFAPDPGREFTRPADRLGGFYGGTLRGITARLDYLAELGVTCLWLSPIFRSPSHHGYDATDYSQVEPRLGTEEDVLALLEEAHRRGLRVILDFVANHVSAQHPAFQAALSDPASREAGWFIFDEWPHRYRTFFQVRDLPQLNTDAAEVRDYLIGHARRWLAAGFDGFRLDYANGPSHAFWSAFRAATREVKPDSVTIGEVVESPALQRTYLGRMDGCLDFLLLEAMRSFFSFRTLSASGFESFLRRHFSFFPADFVLPSFLDNHDMNRFLWTVRGDRRRLRLAALCQFTLPGPPIIYYGTEVGLSQVRDVRYPDGSGHPEEARLPMLWGERQDQKLLQFYHDLIALRRSGGQIWRDGRTPLVIDDAAGLLAYACGSYAVALNNGPEPATISLAGWRGGRLLLATEEGVSWHSRSASLSLPPYAGACVRQE